MTPALTHCYDMLAAMEAIDALQLPLSGPAAALIGCPLVVSDPAQYARAVKHGLAGRIGALRFEACAFDGATFRLAKDTTDEAAHRAAEVSFLLPAESRWGEVFDLAAWIPETGKIAALHGRIGALGLLAVDEAAGGPVIVHDDMLSWFLADEPGLFILDAKLAAEELADVTLSCPDVAAATRLHGRLAPFVKRVPKIVIPQQARAA